MILTWIFLILCCVTVNGGFYSNVDLASLDRLDGFSMYGSGKVGYSVTSIGDVNKDGLDDVLIGAPYAEHGGNIVSGTAYVIFGNSTSMGNVNFDNLQPWQGYRVYGPANYQVGCSVAGLGDVNYDGIDDFIVGAYLGGTNQAGAAYVIYGSTTRKIDIDVSTMPTTIGRAILGKQVQSQFGLVVGNAGDVNGDGVNDILISAPAMDTATGSVYVVYGGWPLQGALDVSTLVQYGRGFLIKGATAGDYTGYSLSGGDVNGDGKSDILIGAYFATTNSLPSAGKAYVIFGKGAAYSADIDLSTFKVTAGNSNTDGIVISGPMFGSQCGASITGIGDVNGDSIPDLAVGCNTYNIDNNHNHVGSVYIVFGMTTWTNIDLNLVSQPDKAVQILGNQNEGYCGNSVSNVRDMNGDGVEELMIGCHQMSKDSSPLKSGVTFVIYGKKRAWDNSLDMNYFSTSDGFYIRGATTNGYSGFSVSKAGDFNGDSKGDLLIGAYGTSKAYVLYGKGSPQPSSQPTSRPTRPPSSQPSGRPSKAPTPRPSAAPTTAQPTTQLPTVAPTFSLQTLTTYFTVANMPSESLPSSDDAIFKQTLRSYFVGHDIPIESKGVMQTIVWQNSRYNMTVGFTLQLSTGSFLNISTSLSDISQYVQTTLTNAVNSHDFSQRLQTFASTATTARRASEESQAVAHQNVRSLASSLSSTNVFLVEFGSYTAFIAAASTGGSTEVLSTGAIAGIAVAGFFFLLFLLLLCCFTYRYYALCEDDEYEESEEEVITGYDYEGEPIKEKRRFRRLVKHGRQPTMNEVFFGWCCCCGESKKHNQDDPEYLMQIMKKHGGGKGTVNDEEEDEDDPYVTYTGLYNGQNSDLFLLSALPSKHQVDRLAKGRSIVDYDSNPMRELEGGTFAAAPEQQGKGGKRSDVHKSLPQNRHSGPYVVQLEPLPLLEDENDDRVLRELGRRGDRNNNDADGEDNSDPNRSYYEGEGGDDADDESFTGNASRPRSNRHSAQRNPHHPHHRRNSHSNRHSGYSPSTSPFDPNALNGAVGVTPGDLRRSSYSGYVSTPRLSGGRSMYLPVVGTQVDTAPEEAFPNLPYDVTPSLVAPSTVDTRNAPAIFSNSNSFDAYDSYYRLPTQGSGTHQGKPASPVKHTNNVPLPLHIPFTARSGSGGVASTQPGTPERTSPRVVGNVYSRSGNADNLDKVGVHTKSPGSFPTAPSRGDSYGSHTGMPNGSGKKSIAAEVIGGMNLNKSHPIASPLAHRRRGSRTTAPSGTGQGETSNHSSNNSVDSSLTGSNHTQPTVQSFQEVPIPQQLYGISGSPDRSNHRLHRNDPQTTTPHTAYNTSSRHNVPGSSLQRVGKLSHSGSGDEQLGTGIGGSSPSNRYSDSRNGFVDPALYAGTTPPVPRSTSSARTPTASSANANRRPTPRTPESSDIDDPLQRANPTRDRVRSIKSLYDSPSAHRVSSGSLATPSKDHVRQLAQHYTHSGHDQDDDYSVGSTQSRSKPTRERVKSMAAMYDVHPNPSDSESIAPNTGSKRFSRSLSALPTSSPAPQKVAYTSAGVPFTPSNRSSGESVPVNSVGRMPSGSDDEVLSDYYASLNGTKRTPSRDIVKQMLTLYDQPTGNVGSGSTPATPRASASVRGRGNKTNDSSVPSSSSRSPTATSTGATTAATTSGDGAGIQGSAPLRNAMIPVFGDMQRSPSATRGGPRGRALSPLKPMTSTAQHYKGETTQFQQQQMQQQQSQMQQMQSQSQQQEQVVTAKGTTMKTTRSFLQSEETHSRSSSNFFETTTQTQQGMTSSTTTTSVVKTSGSFLISKEIHSSDVNANNLQYHLQDIPLIPTSGKSYWDDDDD